MSYYAYDLDTALKNPENIKILHLPFYENLDTTRIIELVNLEDLRLNGFPNDKIPASLPQFAHLKSLQITGKRKQIPDIVFELDNLSNLSLSYSAIAQIPPQINRLKKLKSLLFKSAKFKKLPPEIFQLPELEYLDLENTPIDSLPEEINQLSQLKKIVLTNTKIKDLPLNFALLNLELANLGFTPFHKKLGQNQRKIANLLQQFRKNDFSPALRKLHFQIFLGNFDTAEQLGTLADILSGLNSVNQTVRQQTLFYLYQKTPSPFTELADNQTIKLAVAGVSDTPNWEEIQAKLEENHYQFMPKITAQVDWVVLGLKPKKAYQLALDLNKPVVAMGHLLDYYQSIENYYLSKNDAETLQLAQNLASLLRSEEIANQQLGLEMALGGGINEVYLYDILWLYLWNQNTQIKNLAEKVIKKFMPTKVSAHLIAHCWAWYSGISDSGLTTYLKNLEVEGLDADRLATRFFKTFKSGKKYCLQMPQAFIEVCNSIKQNNVLNLASYQLSELQTQIEQFKDLKILYLQNNVLQNLPNELAKLERLQTLNLAQNSFFEFPLVVTQLKKLEDLDFSNNKLQNLPDDFANLQELKVLHLQRNKLKQLSEAIFQLPKLKVLNISNNPLAKKIKEIKERLPHCKVIF
jgi:Leucine-rich repeat (LRR) protein